MGDFRLDKITAAAVNKGLATALMVNVKTGVKVMSEAGVPPSVVTRVVLNPQRRRASDWKHQ